ncbi:MAG: hypothetical protein ACI9CB_001807 [Rhodothermales bacterium]|jgi:uncharacterized protein (TIGR02001 family)
MKYFRTIKIHAYILLGLFNMAAVADEDATSYTINAAISSEYVFRFVSQTQEKAAVSAGVDWESDSGFHFGVWGSNVDFQDNARLEIDFYGGYQFEIKNGVSFDFGLIDYEYFNDLANDNIVEGYGSVAKGPASLTVYHDLRNHDYYWVEGSFSKEFGAVSTNLTFGTLLPDKGDGYQGWSLSASYGSGEINYSLTAFGTNNEGRVAFGKLADTRLVFSVDTSF